MVHDARATLARPPVMLPEDIEAWEAKPLKPAQKTMAVNSAYTSRKGWGFIRMSGSGHDGDCTTMVFDHRPTFLVRLSLDYTWIVRFLPVADLGGAASEQVGAWAMLGCKSVSHE
eukprot:4957919-Amphidinium_carterae.3